MRKNIKLAYEFGPFRLDAATFTLFRDGAPVPLTPKAFELLLALVEQAGKLIEKEALMRRAEFSSIFPRSWKAQGLL